MSCPALVLTCHDRFSGVRSGWSSLLLHNPSDTIFLTPAWHELWWRTIGEGDLRLLSIEAGDELIGIAPLTRVGDTWGFAGGVEIADFLDVVARPGHEVAVARAVLDYLQAQGGTVCLRNLRPVSIGATAIRGEAERRELPLSVEREDVSPRVCLPGDWESYLQTLSKKDRHELRRKLRRLYSSGEVRYYVATDPAARDVDVDDFIRLHRKSAESKATFMTPAMERFFRALVWELAPSGQLRLYFLEIDGIRVASVILFDYAGEFLLYNSGYDPAYASESVGLLLKAFCLRDAIEAGRRAFDFLQGDEPYKYDLGARDVPIYQLRIDLGPGDRSYRSRGYV